MSITSRCLWTSMFVYTCNTLANCLGLMQSDHTWTPSLSSGTWISGAYEIWQRRERHTDTHNRTNSHTDTHNRTNTHTHTTAAALVLSLYSQLSKPNQRETMYLDQESIGPTPPPTTSITSAPKQSWNRTKKIMVINQTPLTARALTFTATRRLNSYNIHTKFTILSVVDTAPTPSTSLRRYCYVFAMISQTSTLNFLVHSNICNRHICCSAIYVAGLLLHFRFLLRLTLFILILLF